MVGGGIKLPLLISNNVKIEGLRKNAVEIIDTGRFQICIGFDGANGIESNKHGFLIIGKEAKIKILGKALIASGCSIRVDKGTLTIGTNFSCNTNCFISCTKEINIGNDVLLGWNVNIRDSDGHTILQDKVEKPSLGKVDIGNHVWIAALVDILKGTNIPDDCVIGYRSCITKQFFDTNCVIAGYPATVIQKNITWRK